MATATATKLKIRPLDDRLVVRADDPEGMTTGGIVLPDSARQKSQCGQVLAAGPGKLLDSGQRGAMAVKKGDTIYYGKYSGSEIDVDGEKLVILREGDILGIVE